MRIIAWRTRREFANQPRYEDAFTPLSAWRQLMKASVFANPHELKDAFRKVSILKNGGVVFNIGGNKYRLVASIACQMKTVYVKWIGTHGDCDKLNLG